MDVSNALRLIRTHFKNLTLANKWLYMSLYDLADDTNTCALSLRNLSKETGLSVGCIAKNIDDLKEAGLIQIVMKRLDSTKSSNSYHITILDIASIDVQSGGNHKSQKKRQNEQDKIQDHLDRAVQAGLQATLTLGEWIVTLEYFNEACAYCGGDYQVIEHFIPLTLGGGTTKSNCVPACQNCNKRKNSYHPLLMPSSSDMKDAIEHVREYLATYKGVEDERFN